MDIGERSKEGGGSGEETLVARLRRFVEDSDLSFYKIASSVGTSGGTLSMWLAETARPHEKEMAAIEKFLEGEQSTKSRRSRECS
jgi:DNA transposition AAA+ family ATPase